ncbi:MAG: hypothetical protein IPL61_38605 [Myxococcales bacterium]|nr:hypothetical protein [Myxococcales bacterium]
MRALALLGLIAACGRGNAEPAGQGARAPAAGPGAWCVTRGQAELIDGAAEIADPTFRAVAPATVGDRATLAFTYRGPTARTAALASGSIRQQLGLKLRAEDGCNLIYVMWRVAPTAELVVSVKRNPGQHVHRACGVRGYDEVARVPAPALTPGAAGVLAAAIDGDTLAVTIDGAEVWRGPLPAAARELRGPAGVRSDNVVWRARLEAPSGPAAGRCGAPDRDD